MRGTVMTVRELIDILGQYPPNADVEVVAGSTEDEAHLIPVSSDGLRAHVTEDVRIPMGSGLAGRITSSQGGIIFDDLTTVDVLSPFLRDRIKSLMGAPMRVGNRLTGVL
jgi:L-methionine (R)-S-oxide reductase